MKERIEKMKNSKKKGFTLVELLVVIAIMAILALIAVPNFSGYIDKSKDARIQSDLKTVYSAAIVSIEDSDEIRLSDAVEKSEIFNESIKSLVNFSSEIDDYDKYQFFNKQNQLVVEYEDANGKKHYYPKEVGMIGGGETGEFKWKKYKLTETEVVVDVKTENAIGKTQLLFNPIFIFENNLNLKPNALYNVLLSGETFDEEHHQLVPKEYTFNYIKSQNLLNDNQLLEFSGEKGGYRIIQKTIDPIEFVMEQIERDYQDRFLVDLFDLFEEEKELFLDAYKDYDNIGELISSLLESFEIKYGFTPEMEDITESELLLFLVLTDSSIIPKYFDDDYEDFESWGEDFKILWIDLYGDFPEEIDLSEVWGILMIFSIIDLSNYVGIGDTWAIEIDELAMFSPAYESLDRIKIEKLQEVGFVGGEEGDYPENGEKDGYWYVFEGENK